MFLNIYPSNIENVFSDVAPVVDGGTIGAHEENIVLRRVKPPLCFLEADVFTTSSKAEGPGSLG